MNIGDERVFGFRWPTRARGGVAAVEVIDDNAVFREIGKRGIGRDVDGREAAGLFENLFDSGRTSSPIVVIDSVNDDGFELGRRSGE